MATFLVDLISFLYHFCINVIILYHFLLYSYVEKFIIKRKINQIMEDSEMESISDSPSSERRFLFRVVEKDLKNVDPVRE